MIRPYAPSDSRMVLQYPLVQTSLLGGATQPNSGVVDNPNAYVGIVGRRARVLPLAGAAQYPILVETETGSRRMIFDSTPIDFDGDRIRVVPQTMAQFYGHGAVQLSGPLTDSQIINAVYQKPTQGGRVVAGSIANSAGYVGGLYGVESGAGLGESPGLIPSLTYCACSITKLVTTAPSISGPVPLPEFLNRGTAGTGNGGIGAINCVFLGTGEGVIRHEFPRGSGWTDAHTLNKWYLDPLQTWTPGGSLQIGPGGATGGSVAVIEESINLALPTWLYLQLDVNDGGGDVLWTSTITRGGR